jgi:rhamnogalacturonyl hydrolase YesR
MPIGNWPGRNQGSTRIGPLPLSIPASWPSPRRQTGRNIKRPCCRWRRSSTGSRAHAYPMPMTRLSARLTWTKDYPSRAKYVTQFKEMAEELASLQGPDGLWRPGLLDAAASPLPETSGSAFFVFGFAYGINSGILDRAKYQPVVQKAWTGLLSHIYEDGRLGCIQPVGAAPGDYTAASSYVFGTGAFLLAGSEVYRMAH